MTFRPFEFVEHKMTLADAARAAGVSVSAISWRKRHHGLTTSEAAAFPKKKAALARAHGVKKSTLYMRMKTKGLSLEQALKFKSTLSPRGPGTITRRSLAAGMVPTTVHRRMVRHGMTLDEALSFPPMPNRQPRAMRKIELRMAA